MPRARVYILPGRHQPPHNDHLAIIDRALALVDRSIFVALISGVQSRGPAATELEREARLAHEKERNPFSFAERLAMLEASLDERLERRDRARVHVIALPRPEACWSIVTAIFPEHRTWIVPELGERFDDLKAQFFKARGDEVLRFPFTPTTDGRRVRALIRARDPELAHHVPHAVHALASRKEIP